MKKYILPLLLFAVISCKKSADYDASGTFEADEIMVTAEATGKILELKLDEGQQLTENQQIGMIDGKGVELQKEQVLASINAIGFTISNECSKSEYFGVARTTFYCS